MSSRFAIAAAVALALPIAAGSIASAQHLVPGGAGPARPSGSPNIPSPKDYGVTENDRRISTDPMLVGEFVYSQRCSVCHAKTADGQQKYGPHLEGILGRKAGATEWPKQTSALNTSDVVWDEAALDALLQDPDKMMPGVQMDVVVRFKRSRKALIHYLKSL